MRSRLVRLTGLVMLALPAALALGALVAWAWPAGASIEAASIPQAAALTAQATNSGARSIPPERRGSTSPSPSASAGLTKVSPGSIGSRIPTKASTAAVATSISITLCAKAGTKTMPNGVTVNVWGFALGACGAAPATVPGPVLDVAVGDDLTITLDNALAQNVALAFPGQTESSTGQPLIPDSAGAAPGLTKTYKVRVSRPGTFLYEAGGPNAPRQVAMGLYGALLVRSATPLNAYGTPESAYNREAVLVLGEIDPALNGVIPNPPNGSFNMNDYAPKYWLINGQAYDAAAPSKIEVLAGQRLLLRYGNATLSHHTLELLGLHQREIAEDAYPLEAPLDLVSETFPTGQTGDMIVTIPASAAAGTQFPLFSRQLHVTNGASFPGGMLTFVTVVPPGP